MMTNARVRFFCYFQDIYLYIAPTEIIYRIAMTYIFGFDTDGRIERDNFRPVDAAEYAKAGTLMEKIDELFGSVETCVCGDELIRMSIYTDGTTVTQMGSFIHASDGTYSLVGTMLTGPGGFRSMNVKRIDEAVGIVVGLHGGRRF